MRLQQLFAGAVAALTLGIGWLLIPRADEHVTMLVRDGRYVEATNALVAMRDAGDRRPQLLMQFVFVSLRQGDVPGALERIEAYLAAVPDDLAAQEVRAELLLQSGRLGEYLSAADRVVRRRPEAESIARLLARYRQLGAVDAEIGLLTTFAGSRYLGSAYLDRLGALLSARGDLVGAAHWLRLADIQLPLSESTARLRYLHVLLEVGRIEDARRRAQDWMKAWNNAYLAGKLIGRFADAGATDAAMSLARQWAEWSPATTLQVSGVLTESGHASVSQAMLERWIERETNPSAEAVRDYIHASLAAGDRRTPLERLFILSRNRGQIELASRFAEEVVFGYGGGIEGELIAMLPREVLMQAPLLSAHMARLSGNRELAAWYLSRVDASRVVPHQQPLWLQMLKDLMPPLAQRERLQALLVSGHPTHDAKALIIEIARSGSAGFQEAMLGMLRRQ